MAMQSKVVIQCIEEPFVVDCFAVWLFIMQPLQCYMYWKFGTLQRHYSDESMRDLPRLVRALISSGVGRGLQFFQRSVCLVHQHLITYLRDMDTHLHLKGGTHIHCGWWGTLTSTVFTSLGRILILAAEGISAFNFNLTLTHGSHPFIHDPILILYAYITNVSMQNYD